MKRKLFSLIFAALCCASMWATEGALLGRFTINAGGDQIVFSQGNLQYVGTWQFAENQWNCFGASQSDNHRDLFGWGTGDAPNKTSKNNNDYSTFTDWGTNPITNGGNAANLWRTLTKEEWVYLFYSRQNAAPFFGFGSVAGVNGLIILPDNWTTPENASFVASTTQGLVNLGSYYHNDNNDNYSHNTYTAEQWADMESAGAVFLPVAAYRHGTEIQYADYGGFYWSSTPYSTDMAYYLNFYYNDLDPQFKEMRYGGRPVRLVQAVSNEITPEEPYVLQQDGEGNYLLGNLLDWKAFAELVQTNPTANAKMTADINLGDDQTTIGNPGETTYNYFEGTFDGQGHTLTVHYVKQGDKDIRSPFPNISEATIKNIHITGTIESSTACQPAVIGCVRNGTSTIENVWSSVELTSTKSSWCEASGLVGCVDGYRNGNLVMTDCMISGNIISSGSYEGCFIGYINSGGSATVSNCMSVANFTYSGTSGFQGNYTNCYVKQFPSSIPAVMQVTDAQLADGTTTTALQAGRSEEIWVQDPVTNQPMLKIFATTPIEAITANEDPDHAGVYYSTFYDSSKKYALPNDGTEAYAAEVNDGAMYLHKIAEGNDVLPAGTAVIFKATSGTITLTESDDAPVAISVTNHLHGVDVDTEISSVVSGTCYVLSGGSNGVGFYLYEYPNQLKAHKAYIDLNGGGAAQAPKHLRFVFDSATAIETTEADVKAKKRIENGVLYIIKNGVKYNAQGQTVK